MTDTLRVMQPDSLDKLALDTIRLAGLERLSAEARNLLIACNQLTWNEPVILPDGFLKATVRNRIAPAPTRMDDNALRVFPNPATSFFIATYDLSTEEGSFRIELIDRAGKVVESVPVLTRPDQKVIPLVGICPGWYLVILRSDHCIVGRAKLTVY